MSAIAGRGPRPGDVDDERAARRPSAGAGLDDRPAAQDEQRSALRGELVEQRVGHVEHPLERRLADALGRLVVALGAVGEVHARSAPPARSNALASDAAAGDDPRSAS